MSDDPYWNTGRPDEPSGRFTGGDPLVSDTFEGWWNDSIGVLARSWRTVGLILLLGVVLPRWVFGAYQAFAYRDTSLDFSNFDMAAPTRTWDSWALEAPAAFVGTVLGLALLYLFAASALAATRSAAAEAAGGFLSLGEAFSFGFARGWRLWLWLLLGGLTVAVGLALCVLPGLWAAFALSLMVPAATFEHRRSPYARSIQLTHSAFWAALGRLIVVLLIFFAVNLVVGIVGGVLNAVWHGLFGGWFAAMLTVITEGIMALLLLLPMVWVLGAVLCCYAWLRGRGESVSSTSLSAEASGSDRF